MIHQLFERFMNELINHCWLVIIRRSPDCDDKRILLAYIVSPVLVDRGWFEPKRDKAILER